jgi:hypothetical protein
MEYKIGNIFEKKDSQNDIIILTDCGLICLGTGKLSEYNLDKLFIEKYEFIADNLQDWIIQIKYKDKICLSEGIIYK